MKAALKADVLVLLPENEIETEDLALWKAEWLDHVLVVAENQGQGFTLRHLGPRASACNQPINVTSRHPDEPIRLIGNFAETPFELDGRRYGSVEAFWQSLKFDDQAERRRVAELKASIARSLGDHKGYGATVNHEGRTIVVGTRDHWDLMKRACEAKFTQNFDAKEALLATGTRPLTHLVRRDSRAIPGAIMAEIWMEIRKRLAVRG